ncbi:MAG TPA: hypothetical protein VJT15_09765 [Pyrinomonadaceae bacterium]|nr:hypothetical protein [Pyrinomonadaceae bacterium]
MYRINKFLFALFVSAFLIFPATAQTQQEQPLTSNEVVRLLYTLPRDPAKRDEIVEEIRRRGIGFQLTDGMRSLVATKSGNDALLRRTLEEAERRRVNPTASALPSDSEGLELLDRTRNVTLAFANAMPDFLVKQIIKRSYAYGTTGNWRTQDNLTIAVGYRANAGEEYRLLTVNGMPAGEDVKAGNDYGKYAPKGASSSGVEYISSLANVLKPESHTEFKIVDTDLVHNRRTVVYEYVIKKEFSQLTLTVSDTGSRATVGSRGRIWIDRELDRVLRFEQIATEVPGDFPIKAASSLIDYDWVMINERKYLLPIQSQILITSTQGSMMLQSRNDVRFRSYQKYGAELKVIDEIGEDDEPVEPVTPPKPPKSDKPIPPPQ